MDKAGLTRSVTSKVIISHIAGATFMYHVDSDKDYIDKR
jgi:hypothetical protein